MAASRCHVTNSHALVGPAFLPVDGQPQTSVADRAQVSSRLRYSAERCTLRLSTRIAMMFMHSLRAPRPAFALQFAARQGRECGFVVRGGYFSAPEGAIFRQAASNYPKAQ